jgi:hypothetical protein
MKFPLNLFLAWTWMLLAFTSGMVLGLFFHRETWLGGYGSFKRRMYRLSHISFFGTGAINLFFYLTAQTFCSTASLAGQASWLFVAGAISMPLCCVMMAHYPKATMIFAVPVLSLVTGAILTLMEVTRVCT